MILRILFLKEVHTMPNIQSSFTDLPDNCRSAADRMARALTEEDRFADLTEDCQKKLTELEHIISQKTGEKVALVAYRL